MTAHVRMNGHSKYEVVLLPIVVVELVHPQLLDISRVDPAVGIGRLLDEHHRRQIVSGSLVSKLDTSRSTPSTTYKYQLAGISHKPVIAPPSSGFIQCSGCFL